MKLGTKVKCEGYMKKVRTKYVVAVNGVNKFKEENKLDELESEDFIIFGDAEEDEFNQITKEYTEKEFTGLIVAEKIISTSNLYSFPERDIFDPISLGFVDTHTDTTQVKVEKDGYIKCYLVYYRMGGSRLVPIDNTKETS